jgi:DNA-binding MltR family transcriptional regulator
MSSKNRAEGESVRTALRALSRRLPTGNELYDTINALEAGSDRALVVLSTAMLEGSLKLTLLMCFRQGLSADRTDALFGSDKALSSFSAKINLAYALSLIGNNLRHDLDWLRDIRNQCAHAQFHIDFGTKEIAAAIEQLHATKIRAIVS